MIKIENGLLENTKEINEYDETYAYEKKIKINKIIIWIKGDKTEHKRWKDDSQLKEKKKKV